MSDVDEIAKRIVQQMTDGETSTSLSDAVTRERLEDLIAAALRAEREKVAAIAKNDAQDSAASGRISHDEARQMLSRFINSHFGNPGEKARATIPARPEFDDDLRMSAYIQQQRERDAKFAAFADENGEPRKVSGDGLAVTVDGVVLTPGARVWRTEDAEPIDGEYWDGWVVLSIDGGGRERSRFRWVTLSGIGECATNTLYSTQAAAEAAKEQRA